MPTVDNYFGDLLEDVKKLLNKPSSQMGGASKPSLPQNSSKSVVEPLQGNPGPFQSPVKGAKNYGDFDPTGKGNVGRVHQGLDLRAPGGTPIFPLASGVVSKVGTDPKGGNIIVIQHPGNYRSYYAHCSSVSVKPGEKVDLKTQIGAVGDTGNSAGAPHLHLQVWRAGSLIDPRSLFSFENQSVFNAKTEKTWLPGAKEVAKNFSMKEHLAPGKKTVVAKSKYDTLSKRVNLYYTKIFENL